MIQDEKAVIYRDKILMGISSLFDKEAERIAINNMGENSISEDCMKRACLIVLMERGVDILHAHLNSKEPSNPIKQIWPFSKKKKLP